MTLEIDAVGLLCPLPVLRLRKRLLALEPGATARLLASDPAAVIDVPHFCHEGGHELLSTERLPGGVTAYTVRRGPVREAEAPDDAQSLAQDHSR